MQRWINQLRQELLSGAPRIAPVRHATQPDEVPRERRGRSRDCRAELAQTRRCVNQRIRNAHRWRASPDPAGGVEKALHRDWMLITDVIDTMNTGFEDCRFSRAHKVRRGQQLQERRLAPHAKQAPAREPAVGVDHEDASTVDHAEPEHDRCRHGITRVLKEHALFFQSRARMHRDGMAIEPACCRLFNRRRAFHLWERGQNQSADICRDSSGREIGTPARVGLRQKCLRTRSEEPAGKMYDHVGAVDGLRERRRTREISVHGMHVGSRRYVGRDSRVVVHQPQLVASWNEMTREQAAEIPGSTGNQDRSHSSQRPWPSLFANFVSTICPSFNARSRTSSFSQCSQYTGRRDACASRTFAIACSSTGPPWHSAALLYTINDVSDGTVSSRGASTFTASPFTIAGGSRSTSSIAARASRSRRSCSGHINASNQRRSVGFVRSTGCKSIPSLKPHGGTTAGSGGIMLPRNSHFRVTADRGSPTCVTP